MPDTGEEPLVTLGAPVGPQSSRDAIHNWLKRLYELESRYRHDNVARELLHIEIARVLAWIDADTAAKNDTAAQAPPSIPGLRPADDDAAPTPLPAALNQVRGIGYATWAESSSEGFTGSFYTAMRTGTRLFELAGGRPAMFRGIVHTGAGGHQGWLYVYITRIEVRGRSLFIRFRSA